MDTDCQMLVYINTLLAVLIILFIICQNVDNTPVPEECVDDPSCRLIGLKVCEPPLLDYGRVNCRSFCEFCYNVSVPVVPFTVPTTAQPITAVTRPAESMF